MQPLEFKHIIQADEEGLLCDVLAQKTGLSKGRIKRAMACGAVWHHNPKSRRRRVRRATKAVRSGDGIAIYYDDSILKLKPPIGKCIRDEQRYSIWFKPAGLMTQGSLFGDHCALTRQVESHFKPQRQAYVVHRLDRETAGLVIMAHDQKAAAHFTDLFKKRIIKKQYQAIVKGKLCPHNGNGFIDTPLDGRSAVTRYRLLEYNAPGDQSRLQVEIVTGRRHQIRRHFDAIGHPVVGDPIYGRGNKNERGLQLTAYRLTFTCPFGHNVIDVEIDPETIMP